MNMANVLEIDMITLVQCYHVYFQYILLVVGYRNQKIGIHDVVTQILSIMALLD